MSVSAVATGGLEIGQNIFGTNVTSNSVVLTQLTGTAGNIGTYQLSLPSTVSSASSLTSAVATAVFMAVISGTTLTVTSILSGSLCVNHTINGYSKITAIVAVDSSGIGTYTIQTSANVTSSTLMVATVLVGTGDFVYSSNAVLTPGLTLAGTNVDSSTKIVGPKIIASTTSASLNANVFTAGGSTEGTFAAGYGLLGDGISFGTFFLTSTTVNKVFPAAITATPMIAIPGTYVNYTTGSIAKNVLTLTSGGFISGTEATPNFLPGMLISVNASFTGVISTASSTTTLTVTFRTGTLAVGMLVTGIGVPAGTFITAQTSGTAGYDGNYTITYTASLAVSSRTMMAEFVLPANTRIIAQNNSSSFILSTFLPAGITISSKQTYGWKSGTEWIVSASSSVGPIPITASTVGYQHKKAASGTPALTDAAALSYFLGPSTGGGAFSVTVPLADGETSVPQKVLSFVRLLVSKYKPAGIPYTIN
jgi:hypothetical protein